MKLKELKVGEKIYPFHFGVAALYEIETEKGITVYDLIEKINSAPISTMVYMIHIGLKHGQRLLNPAIPFNKTLFDVADMINNNPDIIDLAMSAIIEQIPVVPQDQKKTQANLPS